MFREIQAFFSRHRLLFENSTTGLSAASILIDENITPSLEAFIAGRNEDSVLVVADVHTWPLAGEWVMNAAGRAGKRAEAFVFPEEDLIPDEGALDRLISLGLPSTLFAAVGSGTVNDLVRYAAFSTKNSFISIPTAPSMDGYASSVSPLLIDGVKTTKDAAIPAAIFIRPSVVASAPPVMVSAGIGDLVGKYSSLLDWQLSAAFTGEAVQTDLVEMVRENRDSFFYGHGGNFFTAPACSALIWNLIITGLAISVCGSSRPASGSEHHISHLLETQALQHRSRHFLHGITVGLGSWIILHMYDLLFSLSLSQIMGFRDRQEDNREERLKDCYGSLAEGFIRSWRENSSRREEVNKRILDQPELWDSFRDAHGFTPGFMDGLTGLFRNAGLPGDLAFFGYTRKRIENVIIGAKEIRPRFTILEFLDSLGCLEAVAARVVNDLFE